MLVPAREAVDRKNYITVMGNRREKVSKTVQRRRNRKSRSHSNRTEWTTNRFCSGAAEKDRKIPSPGLDYRMNRFRRSRREPF